MEPDWSDYVRHARRLAESDPENRNGHMVSVPAWMLVQKAEMLVRLSLKASRRAETVEQVDQESKLWPWLDDDSAGAIE